MDDITLRVIDGADRGRVYRRLRTPITIGREEGNTIQLNDERVSRFHVKIQEDTGKLVLTDLESTNGTKVNGEDVQLRILKYGDLIGIGKSLLVLGSRQQIAERLFRLRSADADDSPTRLPHQLESGESALDFELNIASGDDLQAALHALEPPDIPDRMTPAQAAQLSELLEYFHIRIRAILGTASEPREGDSVVVLQQARWQNLVDLQARLAEYLRRIGDPDVEVED